MPAPTTTADLLELIRKSHLLGDSQLEELFQKSNNSAPDTVVKQLQADGVLTSFQAEQLLKGRHKGFVLGKYRLLDRIGMGGMGQVYLAEHASMKRRVALKVLPPDRGKSEFARERFLRESRAAAALEHPNLVRAYDVEMEGDVAFLVMEYIDGVTLHDLIVRRGKIDPARAAHYLWQIANGLQAIHSFSLVHRDIKPANVLLDRGGVVRILDLGLVRSELDDDALTRGEGAKMVGTADYLAPEQAIECSKVDSRADLYSLGCTAYYLLTGQPPFPSDKISQKLIAHQTKAPPSLRELVPGIPGALADLVQQLLAKKPGDRPQSAAEVLDGLAPFAQASLPNADDFPTPGTVSVARNGISLNGFVSMNIVSKNQGSQASGSGSAIRFQAESNPKLTPSQVNQQTATDSTQETLPVPPTAPAKPPAVKPTRRKKEEPPPMIIELPKLQPRAVEPPPREDSTAVKAGNLFREKPTRPQNAERPEKKVHLIAIGLACVLAFAAAVGLYVLGVKP
ncbi:serine/threonine-protein kinase [Limnoglobus roseus]|uniref:Serine/threonine protein kinase n=1 Tax=Limnoglobus roseus TaxID=2598579 RepID=A0A5C1ACZ6_9BACT|nr:serine/threonine-protein kinase [Limnoglobus roseus]QEL16515.1 serine/threonine protein kinase [Limnoglobus roseus]